MNVVKTIYDTIDDEDERMEFVNTIFRKYIAVLNKKKEERDKRLSIIDEKINRLDKRIDALLKTMETQGEFEPEKCKELNKEFDELTTKEKQLKDAFSETERYKYRSDDFYVIEGVYTVNQYCKHESQTGMMICDGLSRRCCSGFSRTHPSLFGGADKQCPCPYCYKVEDCEDWVEFHDYLE